MQKSESDPITDENETAQLATLRQQALGLLARREHGRLELRRKLIVKGAPARLIDRVLEELVADGYLSERRYAESMARSRAGRGYGPLRVRAELAARGVPAELVEQVLEEQSQDWVGQARRILTRRFGEDRPRDGLLRAKQYRYLAQRGFSAEQIRQVLDDADE